jgi:chromate transporter
MRPAEPPTEPSLAAIAKQWGRIGCVGFGGPPAHVALLRELCVTRRGWLTEPEFERGIAATNLLPGPASTQLAIYCAWRLRGARGALLGGLCFVLPGLVAILALSALFLSSSPPRWLRGAGLGAGAAVPAVAVSAGVAVALPIWRRAKGRARTTVLAYAIAGAVAAALAGGWLVLVLLGCGALELGRGRGAGRIAGPGSFVSAAWPAVAERIGGRLDTFARWPLLALSAGSGGAPALAWSAFKVGALAFGGGFVIVPLMQADAVDTYHWMSHAQFLNAVALGQVTPGPVTHTVAAVGYAAGGFAGALLATLVAFAPSFAFVLLGAPRFERLVRDERAVAFLRGAAPAAAGAIIGSAAPLSTALGEWWQYAVLAAAAAMLLMRRGVVQTLLLAGCAGVAAALLGAPIAM